MEARGWRASLSTCFVCPLGVSSASTHENAQHWTWQLFFSEKMKCDKQNVNNPALLTFVVNP